MEKNEENIDKSELFPQTENREVEQYFFSENVIRNLCEALFYEEDIVCLGTPAVAHGFWEYNNKQVTCLDIDQRFNYLPGYIYFDILKPNDIKIKPNIIIIDPPFFQMNLVDLFNCVETLTSGDKNTKILFVYVQREERALLNIFKPYNLKITKFKMEYRYVDPGKWSNYALYSNFEINKIKFVEKNKKIEKSDKIEKKIKISFKKV